MIWKAVVAVGLMAQVVCAQGLVDEVNTFTFKFYNEVTTDDNVVMSPFNLHAVMAMPYLGARGGTAVQMRSVLGYPEMPPTQFAKEIKAVIQHVEGDELWPYVVDLANSVWLSDDVTITKGYRSLMESGFSASMNEVDFSNPARAAGVVNDWVSHETKGAIKQAVTSQMVTPSTRMILVGTLYLKAPWATPFDPKFTRREAFDLKNGRTQVVDMMHQTGRFAITEGPDFLACTLPYTSVPEDNRLALVVILPDKGKFDDVRKALNWNYFQDITSALGYRTVHVGMPKFDLASGVSAEKVLGQMGMLVPFSNDADFSGINGKRDLKIDQIAHAAKLSCDEAGSEAAAATVVTLGLKSYLEHDHPIEFICNRPFIVLLHEEDTGRILFIGQVMTPDVE